MENLKKSEYRITRQDWQDEKLSGHLTCSLCGSDLKFEHTVKHVEQMVEEKATCTFCGVQHRATESRLQ